VACSLHPGILGCRTSSRTEGKVDCGHHKMLSWLRVFSFFCLTIHQQVHPNATVVNKGTRSCIDSYSAFFDNKKLSCTELEEVLRGQNITDVYICGIALDVCVGEKFEVVCPHFVIEVSFTY